mmetsp:Transcript_54005/g.142926  ORF Transcript_54005/g.142926 Transcript_54005/m.142926 type:complete len:332 (-) Transcript_54005:228-1223(-)
MVRLCFGVRFTTCISLLLFSTYAFSLVTTCATEADICFRNPSSLRSGAFTLGRSVPNSNLFLRGGAAAKAAAAPADAKAPTQKGIKKTSKASNDSTEASKKPSKKSEAPKAKGKAANEQDAYPGIEAPKHPLSAYMLYANAIRPEIVKQHPDMKMTEVVKVISAKWKDVNPEEKARYEAEANKAKEEYNTQKAEYEAKVPEEVRKERVQKKRKGDKDSKSSKSKSKRDPNEPKKPLSAYVLFGNKIRDELKKQDPSLSFTDSAKKISQLWHDLPKPQKDEYEAKAIKLKEDYAKAKEQYVKEAATSKADKKTTVRAPKSAKNKDTDEKGAN